MSIPRLIHQIYFQGWDLLPTDTRQAIERFQALNPGWKYTLYDAEAARGFIAEHYDATMIDAFDSIDPAYQAARADLLRYLICYKLGGVYLDVKSSGSRPLDEVVREDDAYLLGQWPILRKKPLGTSFHPELAHVHGGEFVIWCIACAPEHPFLKAVIASVDKNIAEYEVFRNGVGKLAVLRLTGPIAYTLAIEPMLEVHPHRFVCFQEDLGLMPSIHGDHKSHEGRYGLHYSKAVRPLVKTNPFVTGASRLVFGVVRPFRVWLSWKLNGLMRRLGLTPKY